MIPFCSVFILLTLLVTPTRALSAKPPLEVLEGSGAITGKVEGDEKCFEKIPFHNSQVWVSQGSTLLYQTEVPSGGSFEFHLVPGSYEIAASTSKGCILTVPITLKKNEIVHRLLTLQLPKAPKAQKKGNGK